jgi:hypothetical protein
MENKPWTAREVRRTLDAALVIICQSDEVEFEPPLDRETAHAIGDL